MHRPLRRSACRTRQDSWRCYATWFATDSGISPELRIRSGTCEIHGSLRKEGFERERQDTWPYPLARSSDRSSSSAEDEREVARISSSTYESHARRSEEDMRVRI